VRRMLFLNIRLNKKDNFFRECILRALISPVTIYLLLLFIKMSDFIKFKIHHVITSSPINNNIQKYIIQNKTL